jgi:hypothetical protein
LNLIELANLAPGLIADRTGNIDLKFQYRHKKPESPQTKKADVAPGKDCVSSKDHAAVLMLSKIWCGGWP